MIAVIRHKNNKILCLFFLIFSFFYALLSAQVSKSIRNAVEAVPKPSDAFLTYTHLKSQLSAIANSKSNTAVKEKKEVNVFLANYAVKCAVFEEAGRFYMEAFNLARSMGEKDAKKYLIKAIKVFIIGGHIEEGYIAYGKLVSIKEDAPSKYDKEAELYIQYLKIAEMISSPNEDIEPIIKKLKDYAKDVSFKEFKPSILLTLWFIANDVQAEKYILKEYPLSIEAMIVRGEAIILPSTFWYLLPKNSFTLEASQNSEQSNVAHASSAKVSTPKAYQIGFFKLKGHAEKQKEKLTTLGFTVEIKEEMRTKNMIYYAVFVLETERGHTGLRLKDAGFESFPIFD